jgi:hypothetical protein
MDMVRALAAEIRGMFFSDGRLAAAVVLVVALAAALRFGLHWPPFVSAIVLVVGAVTVLGEAILRQARKG